MSSVKRTARIAGLAYLGLAITGMLGFLVIRQQLYVPDDATRTAANLIANKGLARLGLVADIGMILTQTASAIWFWKLFRPVHSIAAGSIAAFGMVNAVVILVATTYTITALDVALRGDAASAAQALQLFELAGAAYSLGGLFFGLWLIPMGWLAWRSGYMPRFLGWLLIGGGVGYIMSVLVAAVFPSASGVVSALTMPATAGELWMVGYLLIKGVSGRATPDGQPAPSARVALT